MYKFNVKKACSEVDLGFSVCRRARNRRDRELHVVVAAVVVSTSEVVSLTSLAEKQLKP